jgi:hypothetical protein
MGFGVDLNARGFVHALMVPCCGRKRTFAAAGTKLRMSLPGRLLPFAEPGRALLLSSRLGSCIGNCSPRSTRDVRIHLTARQRLRRLHLPEILEQ